jgi:hypothetical protein
MDRRLTPLVLVGFLAGGCGAREEERPAARADPAGSRPPRLDPAPPTPTPPTPVPPGDAVTDLSAHDPTHDGRETSRDPPDPSADTDTGDAPMPANADAEIATTPTQGPLAFTPKRGPGGVLPYEPKAGADAEPGGPSSAGWDFGWTADSQKFVYCERDASDEGGSCWVHHHDGKGESFGYAKFAAFAKANGPFERGTKHWPYGDITITSRRDGAKLSVGGRVASDSTRGKPDMFTFEFDEEVYADGAGGDVGTGIVSVAPNGKEMAIVGAAVAGFVDQHTEVQMVGTADFAAQIYAAHAFEHLHAEHYERAAAWFARAAAVHEHWKYPYNLACARARGGLDGAEAALRTAIERGGSQVKKKAGRDEDLAKVREAPWFAPLVGS